MEFKQIERGYLTIKNNKMDKVKKILLSNQAKRVYWTTLNGFIGLAVVYFAELNWFFAPVIIGVLNSITKEINKRCSA